MDLDSSKWFLFYLLKAMRKVGETKEIKRKTRGN